MALAINFEKNSKTLRIVFLDVGQGDSILISQGPNQMLIDGGRNGKLVLEKLGKYIPFWDRNIEIVVATHPDQDHIGGLIDIMKSYNVRSVLETKAESDSQTFRAWKKVNEQEGAQFIEAVRGTSINFSDFIATEILYPFSTIENSNKNSNNQYSVVIKLAAGQDKFLFTGDLAAEQELALIKENSDLVASVLKVSHHGSKYSTSEEFLTSVKPRGFPPARPR